MVAVTEVDEHVQWPQRLTEPVRDRHHALMEPSDLPGRMLRAMLRSLKHLRPFDPKSIVAIDQQKVRCLMFDEVAGSEPRIQAWGYLNEDPFLALVGQDRKITYE